MYINCLVVSLLSLITVIHGKWVWQEDKSSPEEDRNSISFSDIISVQKQVKDQVSSIENTSSNGGELASILDVHHPDSPYGLIQDVLKQQKPVTDNFLPSAADLGGLDAKEVWLSQGDLLVLKGTSSLWWLIQTSLKPRYHSRDLNKQSPKQGENTILELPLLTLKQGVSFYFLVLLCNKLL